MYTPAGLKRGAIKHSCDVQCVLPLTTWPACWPQRKGLMTNPFGAPHGQVCSVVVMVIPYGLFRHRLYAVSCSLSRLKLVDKPEWWKCTRFFLVFLCRPGLVPPTTDRVYMSWKWWRFNKRHVAFAILYALYKRKALNTLWMGHDNSSCGPKHTNRLRRDISGTLARMNCSMSTTPVVTPTHISWFFIMKVKCTHLFRQAHCVSINLTTVGSGLIATILSRNSPPSSTGNCQLVAVVNHGSLFCAYHLVAETSHRLCKLQLWIQKSDIFKSQMCP